MDDTTKSRQHFQEGRLDPAELDDRTGSALRARALVPVLVAAVLVTAALTAGAPGAGWHHQWGAGVGWWPVLWLFPLLIVRLLWWGRRPGRARSWR